MVRRPPPHRRFFSIALLPLPFFLILVFSGCEDSVGPENEGVCALQSEIPVSECQALVAFYEATNGEEWESATGWTESAAPCSWHGIVCENGTVIEISLNQNHLTGSLNPELANLTNLKEFWVGMNELGGTIPPELGGLSALEFLYLFRNNLSGSIPPELGNLQNLKVLFLWGNDLTGAIPLELGGMSSLLSLELRQNQLSGAIPPELGDLPAIWQLDLSENELTGGIPHELGGLSRLKLFLLHDNLLEGSIPLEVIQLGGAMEDEGDNCQFLPGGNEGLYIADNDENRAADLDADGSICGVLVPAGTS